MDIAGRRDGSDLAVQEETIRQLRLAVHDPAAGPGFERTTGSFIWPDERFVEFLTAAGAAFWMPRAVVIFRSSLILGEPREDCRLVWDELLSRCPRWPCFRPDRRSPDLRDDLLQYLGDPEDEEYRDHRRLLIPPGLSLPTDPLGPAQPGPGDAKPSVGPGGETDRDGV